MRIGLLGAVMTAAFTAVVVGVTSTEMSCRECLDADDLPIVHCKPLPAGANGCVGLPHKDAGVLPLDDAGPAEAVYPESCQVRVDFAGTNTCDLLDCFCLAEANVEQGQVVKRFRWMCPL